MIIRKNITITRIDSLNRLCKLANEVNSDVIAKKGHFIVNCKSIMGLISIDTSTGVTIEYDENLRGSALHNFINSCENRGE